MGKNGVLNPDKLPGTIISNTQTFCWVPDSRRSSTNGGNSGSFTSTGVTGYPYVYFRIFSFPLFSILLLDYLVVLFADSMEHPDLRRLVIRVPDIILKSRTEKTVKNKDHILSDGSLGANFTAFINSCKRKPK